MAFLGHDNEEAFRSVEGEGIWLRRPELKHYSEWANLRAVSRTFLTPWEPTWPVDDLTRESFRARLRRYSDDARDGRSFPFFILRNEDGVLVGGLTLSRVQRGVAQSGVLGYWIGAPYQRNGYMLSAVRALIRLAFDPLDLHRIEAACVPENTASRSLLLKAGFREEGLARSYLRINGMWRDHCLFGLVRSEP
jgi:ribosomal-protein-alanine N-acetyltransferase